MKRKKKIKEGEEIKDIGRKKGEDKKRERDNNEIYKEGEKSEKVYV